MEYNAPYESPIEQELFTKLRGHQAPDVSIDFQVAFKTQCGEFRVDALMTQGEVKVALECDGKDFHDARRDEWRDAVLLGEGHVESVIRFPGRMIVMSQLGCIYAIALWHTEMFTERALAMLRSACKWIDPEDADGLFVSGHLHDDSEDAEGVYRYFVISRRSRSSVPDIWEAHYKFVLENKCRNIDDAIDLWKRTCRGAARIVNGK